MAEALDRIRGLAEEAARAHGLEVEDVRLSGGGRRTLLRVTIDKPGGVTLGDCEAVSRDLEAQLDVGDIIKSRYTLEVSSPGLDRPLRSPKDFLKQSGKLVRVVLKEKAGGQGFLIGRVVAADENEVVLDIDGSETAVAFGSIARARLEIEIK